MKRNGFTLLEILVVIVIIGILATLVAGSASFAMRVAREKRVSLSCRVLETAIHRYRSEYNDWPGGYTGENSSKTFSGDDNKKVFGMLRIGSADNPDNIQFIDETAFFTTMSGGKEAQKLSETDPSTSRPLVFLSRSGKVLDEDGNYHYYSVTIDYDDEMVKVEAPGFQDEDEDD